jgi:hypothetical protein
LRGAGSEVRRRSGSRPCSRVHKALATVAEDDDLDLDPALAACVQAALYCVEQ